MYVCVPAFNEECASRCPYSRPCIHMYLRHTCAGLRLQLGNSQDMLCTIALTWGLHSTVLTQLGGCCYKCGPLPKGARCAGVCARHAAVVPGSLCVDDLARVEPFHGCNTLHLPTFNSALAMLLGGNPACTGPCRRNVTKAVETRVIAPTRTN